MPQSKTRPHHHPQQHHPARNVARSKKTSRAVIIFILFFGLAGMGIGYFIAGNSFLSLATGTIIGAVSGYLFGHQIDNAASKK